MGVLGLSGMIGVVGREFGLEREGVRGDSRPDAEEDFAIIRVLDSVDSAALYFLTVEDPVDGEGVLLA